MSDLYPIPSSQFIPNICLKMLVTGPCSRIRWLSVYFSFCCIVFFTPPPPSHQPPVCYHNFYHKLLPQTTTLIWGSISTNTLIIFFFNLTMFHFYHKFYHKILPQTTTIIGVSISTTTPIFVPIWQCFIFTRNVTTYHYHKPLPLPPPHPTTTMCSVAKVNTGKILRGLQRFWGGCEDCFESSSSRSRSSSSGSLVLGFWYFESPVSQTKSWTM